MAGEKKKILIIDDEESIRDGCYQTLSKAGFQVDTTGDALRGLEYALKDIFDVILLDIRMPKMDGIELLRRLKGLVKSKIIVITGYGTIPLSVEAMRLGAFDFLTKPFTTQEIKNVVIGAVESKEPSSNDEP
ncbi:MAG: response regulator, partial [Syntrophales bacterium LBB04]|nr:response regulator [Syntrophales bacterium LBB04]